MAEATMKDVMNFFGKNGKTLKDFTAEWGSLTDSDKAEIKEGLGKFLALSPEDQDAVIAGTLRFNKSEGVLTY